MNKSDINLAVIGCGRHARHHADNLPKGMSIAMVWDKVPEAMKANFPQERHADTLDEVMQSKLVDAVMICSEDGDHFEQARAAINNSKHVFCEKPLIVPGQKMLDLKMLLWKADMKENRLSFATCHPRRFDGPAQEFKRRIGTLKEGCHATYGKVLNFSFDFSYHKPSNEWKGERSLMLDHLNHEVDLMNFFFGIDAFEAMRLQDSFDHYHVVGCRDDGIAFNFIGTRRLEARRYDEECRIRFERAEVVLDMRSKRITIVDHEDPLSTMSAQLDNDYDKRLLGVMDDFASQIRGRTGYLTHEEMLMNAEVGDKLQLPGVQRVEISRR